MKYTPAELKQKQIDDFNKVSKEESYAIQAMFDKLEFLGKPTKFKLTNRNRFNENIVEGSWYYGKRKDIMERLVKLVSDWLSQHWPGFYVSDWGVSRWYRAPYIKIDKYELSMGS